MLLLGEKFKGKKEKKSSRRTRMRQRAVDREIRRISPGDRITSEEEIKRGKREVMTKWGEGDKGRGERMEARFGKTSTS